MKKIVKIHFLDGSFHVFNDVLEYVSGIYHFFIAQKSDSNSIKSHAFDRDTIEYVERRTFSKVWKKVKLKKKLQID